MGKPFTAERLANIRRMRRARRLYRAQPLFAYEILRTEYPGYTHTDFLDDLRYRSRPKRRKGKSSLLRYGRYFRMLEMLRMYDATRDVAYAIQAQRLRRYMTKPYRVLARVSGQLLEFSFSALLPIGKIERITAELPLCGSLEEAEDMAQILRQDRID